ncbi:MAG: CHAT domain-containing tetratricopeptide repeat protein [Cyclobacteriaceae bacterium]
MSAYATSVAFDQPDRISFEFNTTYAARLDSTQNIAGKNALLDSLETFYNENGHYENLVSLYQYKSRQYLDDGKITNALATVDKSLKLLQDKLLPRANPLSIQAYIIKADIRTNEGSFDDAIDQFDKALNLATDTYGAGSNEVADLNLLMGNLYNYFMKDYLQAEIHYETARRIFEKSSDIPYDKEFELVYSLASVNRNQEDYEKAINYGHHALSIIENQADIDTARWVYGLQIVANSYNENPDSEKKALTYYKKLLSIPNLEIIWDSVAIGNLYKNVGICYRKAHEYDSSLMYFERGRDILEYQSVTNPVAKDYLINTHHSIGVLYTNKKNYNEAKTHLFKAIVLSQKTYGAFSLIAGKAYHTLSEIYYEQGLYSSSLKSVRKSLLCRTREWNSSSLNDNPSIEQLVERSRTQETFILKGKNYLKLYEQTGKSQFLHHALYTFNYADELLQFMRSSYSHDNTILKNSELYKELYENTLATIYQMASNSQNEKYLNLAFIFMEKNSAGLLLENLIAAENKFEIGISDSLIRAERNLRAEADRIQSEIQNRGDNSGNEVQELREELYSLNQQIGKLEDKISVRFPAYYNIKYQNQEFASLADIREKLTEEDLYVSYYVGKRSIFILGIHHDEGVKLFKINYNKKLKAAFSRVLDTYSMQSSSHYKYDSYKSFVEDSHYLYSQLLEPVLGGLNPENEVDNLIVVTNGELGLLPFESLLTDTRMSDSGVDYRNLSYLITSYGIQYAYSGTMFDRQLGDKLSQNRAKVLAFGYSDDDGVDGVKDELKGSVYELRALQNMLVGDFLQGSRATETAFKAKAQNSDILHLALHGEANRQNPLGSAIYFRSQSDSINDGRLYPYELYPLNLNSRLVVLSSCETGIGKSYSGEGIYSMGRSFSYAGCPSIVMTLWKLNDRITADIMEDFYVGLTKGQKLDESLRRSKLNYLQEADELTAHPVNWAAFVAIGDMSSIRPLEKKNTFYLMIAIALIIPTIILAIKMLLFNKK